MNMKKIVAVLLAVCAVLSFSVPAFADSEGSKKGGVSAVAIVREWPGLPLVANAYVLRRTRNANGSTCDEEIEELSSENVKYYTAEQLDLMPEESRRKFEASIKQLSQVDEDIMKYLFWIELTGPDAGKVGEQADGSKNVLDMWFSDYEDTELYAKENDHDAELSDSIKHGNYRLTLQETGTVIITTVGYRDVEGVVEVIREREIEPKMIWVESPEGHWIEDPDAPEEKTERYSEYVPTFTREEYEIKLVVSRTDYKQQDDELITYVPADDMFIITFDQIESLTPEAREAFIREYERIRDLTGYAVQYFFFIDLSDEYRDLVGEQEDGSIQYLLLSFSGDRDDYTTTSNGNPMECYPDDAEEGTYLIKLSELGALAIMYPSED